MSSDTTTGQEIETLILGEEWDDDLIKTLKQSLLDLGAEAIDSNWSVGGSQEIVTEKWKLDNDLIDVEAETYVGLSITGPKTVLKRIQERLGLHT